ncbi:MAG: hypothetical protein OXN27_11185 [Candidatus Poribacteria bacterium]|nr:hypothetical protein [Candidatus Poribacteria bacterium]
MNRLNRKLNELRQRDPELGALLDELLSYKDGQGDYALDRYELRDPDIDTIVKEIQQARKAADEEGDLT